MNIINQLKQKDTPKKPYQMFFLYSLFKMVDCTGSVSVVTATTLGIISN